MSVYIAAQVCVLHHMQDIILPYKCRNFPKHECESGINSDKMTIAYNLCSVIYFVLLNYTGWHYCIGIEITQKLVCFYRGARCWIQGAAMEGYKGRDKAMAHWSRIWRVRVKSWTTTHTWIWHEESDLMWVFLIPYAAVRIRSIALEEVSCIWWPGMSSARCVESVMASGFLAICRRTNLRLELFSMIIRSKWSLVCSFGNFDLLLLTLYSQGCCILSLQYFGKYVGSALAESVEQGREWASLAGWWLKAVFACSWV